MKIAGLQKLTLLDFPGKIACTIFTHGCNFRCSFCQNSSLVISSSSDFISEEDIFDFLKSRKNCLEGVAITGGEPLLQNGIDIFISKIKDLGFLVKLDTNGSFPDKLMFLVNTGLVDYVAMDIKNSPDNYKSTAAWSTPDFMIEKIKMSKDYLLSDVVDYEFRTTVVKGIHTEQNLLAAAKWISGAKAYYLQQYKNSGEVINPEGLHSYTDAEMQHLLKVVQTVLPCTELRGV